MPILNIIENHFIYLTKREVEVLNLIAEGYTNHEIGGQLFISPQTVDTHRKNLIKKLEVRNSVQLISKSLRQGLIT